MSTIPLPAKASLSQLRARAKDLRRAVTKARPDALDRVRAHHPAYGGEFDPARFTLRDAQLTIAREDGLAGWSELMEKVATELAEGRELHRYFGVELNNETWDLMEQIDETSPRGDQERLLYGAYAACLHWLEAGNEANHARGEYLIARAALRIGRASLGLEHAQRCLELVLAHPGQMSDWDKPFAHEALARALAATGAPDAAQAELARAVELTTLVADPGDQNVLHTELSKEPWFGLRT
ncbi:hypothetical protein F1D05_08330 [Kribbella qitaiheensis]|uniref:Tetratricopeptide repeat protein n=1 Tax=Kribbella qitaiheensis TaxID=1544730 RepID=A0A7G6WV82_9ACTN|nr:hypothetical protein [Kribbella qitaiheensis]QNE17897.1 hypothetical protein F1D05_08330 [Kribbella qitaiheensis]